MSISKRGVKIATMERQAVPAPASSVLPQPGLATMGRRFAALAYANPDKAAAALITVIAVFYLSTIRAGQDWLSDDFAMYIHQAKNLAEGITYTHTGYIYDRLNPEVGPRLYPPVFPLLLAPLYRWFGLDLTPMKVEVTLFWVLALAVIYQVVKRHFSPLCALLTVGLLGLNPFFWSAKDAVLSDIPFLFFAYASIWLIMRAGESERSPGQQYAYTIATGLLLMVTFDTRTLGIALLLALVAYDLIRLQRVSRTTLGVTGVFVALLVLQQLVVPGDSSYLDQFSHSPERVLLMAGRNAVYYATQFHYLWQNGYAPALTIAVGGVIYALALLGFIVRLKERLTFLEVFFCVYVAIVAIWPSQQGIRFDIPIIPLFVAYALYGVGQIPMVTTRRAQLMAYGALTTAILVSYAGQYAKSGFGPIAPSIGGVSSIRLFHFVQTATPSTAVFVIAKPRTLALFTDRRASVYHQGRDDELWSYFRAIRATHLVVGRFFPTDRTILTPFVARHRGALAVVYTNPDFTVYRIRGYGTATR